MRISQNDLKILRKKLYKATGEHIPSDVLAFVMRKKGHIIERK